MHADMLPAEMEQAIQTLLQLPPKQRLAVSRRLEASLTQAEIDAAWSAEIARRLSEIESGAVQGIPADEVFRRIRKRLDARRAKPQTPSST